MTDLTPILKLMVAELLIARSSAQAVEEACEDDSIPEEDFEDLFDSTDNLMELVLDTIGVPPDPVVREEFWNAFRAQPDKETWDTAVDFVNLAMATVKKCEQQKKQ